jgi:hypothetical protein
VQAAEVVQDTLFRRLLVAALGLAVGWIVQVVPFHASARVPPLCPTAVHSVALAQDTLARSLEVAPEGFGVDCVAQVVPFQPAASVDPLFDPTAAHAAAALQDTPTRATGIGKR